MGAQILEEGKAFELGTEGTILIQHRAIALSPILVLLHVPAVESVVVGSLATILDCFWTCSS